MSYLEYEIAEIRTVKELKTFINKNIEAMTEYDWFCVIKSPGWSNSLLEEFPDHLPWDSLCIFNQLPVDIMDKYSDKLDWYPVSCFQALDVAFIKKYVHKLSLDKLINNSKLNKEAEKLARELYNKYNDPEHHKIWDENLAKCRCFCPRDFKGKYDDYEKTPGMFPGLEIKKESVKSKPEVKAKKKSKSSTKKSKETLNYDVMTKAQLKEILAKRNVRTLYHDTLDILRKKCRDSEEG